VSKEIAELERTGYVVRRPEGRSNEIRLSPTGGVAVGIELGYQHIAVLARQAHEAHHDVRHTESRTVGAATALIEECVRVISDLVEQAVDQTGRSLEDLATVGLALPRMVHPRDGRLTKPLLLPWIGKRDPTEA
jgi:hypothetical protein